MPIQIINDWKVSIRPCEFKNYENIFASDSKEYSRTKEYDEIMSFFNKTGLNLIEIVDFLIVTTIDLKKGSLKSLKQLEYLNY
jgi:hypothetical protein